MSSRFTVKQLTRFVARRNFVLAALGLALAAALLTLYSIGPNEGKPLPAKNMADNNAPRLEKFITHENAKTVPQMPVTKADGTAFDLAALRGELVLVNFWATWCAPCRKEMPQLDSLAARYADKGVKVVTLSVDRGGPAKGEKFLNELNVSHVVRLYDPSYKSARVAALIGLPTTLLVNADGLEIGRLAGEADWDAPEVHALLDYYLEK